jgi:hypothetical protein
VAKGLRTMSIQCYIYRMLRNFRLSLAERRQKEL